MENDGARGEFTQFFLMPADTRDATVRITA